MLWELREGQVYNCSVYIPELVTLKLFILSTLQSVTLRVKVGAVPAHTVIIV
jgi:hypothetical protein